MTHVDTDQLKIYWVELSVRFKRIDVLCHLLAAQSYSYLTDDVEKARNSFQCRISGEEFELVLGTDHNHLKLKRFVGLDQCFSNYLRRHPE